MVSLLVEGASALKPGQMKKFSIGGTDVLITNLDGTFYAIANTCTHMGGSLEDGVLENGVIRCPRHGAQYDAKTGENVGPLTMFLVKKKTAGVRAFPLEIKDGQIYVKI